MRFSHLVLVVIRPLYMQAEIQVSRERLRQLVSPLGISASRGRVPGSSPASSTPNPLTHILGTAEDSDSSPWAAAADPGQPY